MTVVVGYVPTREGRAALETATQECLRRGDHLVVVDNSRADPGDPAARERSEEVLAELRPVLEEAGVDAELRPCTPGVEPSEDLLTVADEVSATMLVIGLRRRTPVGKLILGSGAQRILFDAPCPVLAVKPS